MKAWLKQKKLWWQFFFLQKTIITLPFLRKCSDLHRPSALIRAKRSLLLRATTNGLTKHQRIKGRDFQREKDWNGEISEERISNDCDLNIAPICTCIGTSRVARVSYPINDLRHVLNCILLNSRKCNWSSAHKCFMHRVGCKIISHVKFLELI